MASIAPLIKLADRYAALGLRVAAGSVYERAAAVDPRDPVPARRMAELALAAGDGRTARRYAEELGRRAPSPSARLLGARALLASGELAAARFALAAVLDAAGVDSRLRAAAYLGRAELAAREGDGAGAAAHLSAAAEELLGPAGPRGVGADEARLAEEIATRAVTLNRAGELLVRARELGDSPVHDFCVAALLAARQAHGAPGVSDGDIETALERALAADPAAREVKLRLALRLSRRRYRDAGARARAIALLEELAIDAREAERARVAFLLGGLYEDDPAQHGAAEEAYRRGLKLRPRHAPSANNLALLALHKGDVKAARAELARALRLDPGYDVAWLNAVRLLDTARPADAYVEDVAIWLDAAGPGTGALCGEVAARLVRATAEAATGSVLEALYSKGHRLKNLLGIAGARVRSARKAARTGADVDERLGELERDLGALYDEWAAHLRTLQAEGPRVEIVPINGLVAEVVTSATQEGRPQVRFVPGAALPDLRADRALLREALLNLLVNALDAQEASRERDRPVEVVTRALTGAAGAPAIAVEIRDHGGGIRRVDMGRLFAPGFTTKAQGSGLGLAVANRVVVAHHGRILVDTEEGMGTTMTVVLPTDLGGFSSLAGKVSRAE